MRAQRENWGTRIGVILAVAGSAVGLGNFLRFPAVAAQNGGGAFMLPYLVSLLLLGIPLMLVEWTVGRYGGGFGHGTAPGIFQSLWRKNRFIKYFGVIGIFGPLVILMYYTYIESWLLGYAVLSLTPRYAALTTQEEMGRFLAEYRSSGWSVFFFILTFVANASVIYFGVRRGIERFCRLAMPVLFLLAAVLVCTVLFFTPPNPQNASWNAWNGLAFLWRFDFSRAFTPAAWLAAAGQIFFTLSVGIGVILTYASYLRKSDDVVHSGIAAAGTNEFAEVVLGGSLVLPAAFIFMGPDRILEVARSGTFNLGFVTMPFILQQLPFAALFSAMWFLLLFLAGITSSISLAQPMVAFLEDEFEVERRDATVIFAVLTFLACLPAVLIPGDTVIGELDFWAVNVCLVVFALVESILFGWVFGIDQAWDEMHRGAGVRLPATFKVVFKYITPALLVVILAGFWLEGLVVSAPGGVRVSVTNTALFKTIAMQSVPVQERPVVLFTRIYLLTLFALITAAVWEAWRRRGCGTQTPVGASES